MFNLSHYFFTYLFYNKYYDITTDNIKYYLISKTYIVLFIFFRVPTLDSAHKPPPNLT